MNELIVDESGHLPAKTCINCGSRDVIAGHPNALCAGCRTALINYPIPKWVWLFAGGIGILLLISLVNLPKNLSLGIDLERGIKSVNEHKFMTAEKELKTFAEAVPQSEEGNAYLMIASFTNLDFETFGAAYQRIKDKKIDDEDLYNRVVSVMDNMSAYYPSDSLDSFYAKHSSDDTTVMYAGLKEYADAHPAEIYALTAYGSHLLDVEQYEKADSVYNNILQKNGNYLPALYAMATIKRIEGKPQEAISICDRMIAINKEDAYAMSMKARALLRENKNAEALHMAQASAALEPDNPYNRATLTLAYHFNKMEKEKNTLIQAMNADRDSSAMQYYQYALDVINNKQTFR